MPPALVSPIPFPTDMPLVALGYTLIVLLWLIRRIRHGRE